MYNMALVYYYHMVINYIMLVVMLSQRYSIKDYRFNWF